MQMLSYHLSLKEQIIGKDLHVEQRFRHIQADRSLKYKSWNAENMLKAILAV